MQAQAGADLERIAGERITKRDKVGAQISIEILDLSIEIVD